MHISPDIAREIINRHEATQVLNGLGALAGKKKKKKETPEEKAARKAREKAEKEERKALHKLTSKKERKKIAKRAKRARKKLKSATGFIGDLNDGQQPNLPLTTAEEQFRQFSVAGDFDSMNMMAPFGPNHWRKITPLGKYRFMYDSSGRMHYVSFSESDITRFLNGPWLIRDPKTGLAPLLHPKRKIKIDKPRKIRRWTKRAEKAAAKYPPEDMRHVSIITPGEYTYKSGETSAWVEFRAPIMIAVAIVASVYLGPFVLQAVQAMYAKAAAAVTGVTGGGGGAAAGSGAAGWGSKIFNGAKKMTGYVNNARTVKAMAEGETPPPPISIEGDNFTDWAMAEAKTQLKNEAMEHGQEWAADQLTASQEAEMRREIQKLQREIAAQMPADIPMTPGPGVSNEVQSIMVQEKEKNEQINNVAMVAIPAALAYFMVV